jgi:MFS family permease
VRSYLELLRAQPHFLAFGALLTASASFGQTWFISLFSADIRAHFALSHGDFGAIYSLATLLSAVSLIWVGRLIDHVPLMKFCTMTFAGLAVASLGLAYSPNVLCLGVAIFGLRLCGQGLLSHIATTSMARFFDEHRGKAISVSSLGFPVAEAILPLTVVAVSAALGWSNSWVAWAAMTLVVLLPVTLFLLRASRPLWNLRPHLTSPTAVTQGAKPGSGRPIPPDPAKATTPRRPVRSWTRKEVLRDRRFHLLLPYLLAPAFISTGVMFHQVYLVQTKGWTLEWFATGFIAYGAAKVISSLIGGPLVDRYSARVLFSSFLTPLAAGTLFLAMSDHPSAAIVFLALAGVTTGLNGPIGGAFWAELYGPRHLGSIRAMSVSIMVLGSALSPFVFGWLFDLGVQFSTALYGCAILGAGSTGLAVIAMRASTQEL